MQFVGDKSKYLFIICMYYVYQNTLVINCIFLLPPFRFFSPCLNEVSAKRYSQLLELDGASMKCRSLREF